MASIHYSFDDARSYLLEGSVNAAGDALEWLRTRFGLFKDYAELDDLCWKASTDVAAFIGLNGTGAPHWETGVSSLIHGLTAESSSADIVRAVVEGIAFFLADIAAALKDAAVEPRSLTASGGLASLTYLMQALADILGMDLSVSAEQEASAKGAAFLAGMRHGTWSAWDIKSMLSAVETVTARTNPGLRKRYSRWKELHRVTRELDLG
jgi:glycerol kinase